jgi:Nucleotide modification associated domain 3
MKGLLVRVAADQTEAGGRWNGPVNSDSGQFVYVAIPEYARSHPGLNKPYEGIRSALSCLNIDLPSALSGEDMHLDPDFDHLTYGDVGERAKQIRTKVGPGDLLVFYAGLRDMRPSTRLVYALIGLYVVKEIVNAVEVAGARWHENAHTRRVLSKTSYDIVVRARQGVSGRLDRCIPIGNYRDRAYRVSKKLLTEWGGLSVNDGYLQRSARLPEFLDAERFYTWFQSQKVMLKCQNN